MLNYQCPIPPRKVQCTYVKPGSSPPSSGYWFDHMTYSQDFYTLEDCHRVPGFQLLLEELGVLKPGDTPSYPGASLFGPSRQKAHQGDFRANSAAKTEEVRIIIKEAYIVI